MPIGSVAGPGRVAGPSQTQHILWPWAELPPSPPPSITACSQYGRSRRNQAGASRSLCPELAVSWSDDISPEGHDHPVLCTDPCLEP